MQFGRILAPCLWAALLANGAVAHAAETQGAAAKPFAEANLRSTQGNTATSTVRFFREAGGVRVDIAVAGATPGAHGMHIHEKGDCSAPDASSAGAHFNPASGQHGAPNAPQSHLGDLGNVQVGSDGTGTSSLQLNAGVHGGTVDWNVIIGKGVILHASADDLVTQPTGNSGGRQACGVIEKVGG